MEREMDVCLITAVGYIKIRAKVPGHIIVLAKMYVSSWLPVSIQIIRFSLASGPNISLTRLACER